MLTTPDMFTITEEGPLANPDCEWVLKGLGRPMPWRNGRTVRLDDDDQIWIEHPVKPGGRTPKTFEDPQETPQGHIGWTRLEHTTPAVRKAATRAGVAYIESGKRYELVGPGINRNPHKLTNPTLYLHNGPWEGSENEVFGIADFPRNYYALVAWLRRHDYRGIVWFHHDDPTVTAKFTR